MRSNEAVASFNVKICHYIVSLMFKLHPPQTHLGSPCVWRRPPPRPRGAAPRPGSPRPPAHSSWLRCTLALRLCAANWDSSMALLAAAAAPVPIQFSWLISGEDRRDITNGQTVATWPRTRRVFDIGGYKTFCQNTAFYFRHLLWDLINYHVTTIILHQEVSSRKANYDHMIIWI